MILAIFIFFVLVVFGFYNTEYRNNELVRDMIQFRDIKNFYDFYITSNPNIDGRSYYGSEDASITIIVYLDPSSESSRQFIKDILPQTMNDFINPRYARFYPKNYITMGDFNEKNERFIYAQSQLCVKQFKEDSFHDFYLELFDIESTDEIVELVKKYNISGKEFNECLKEQEFEELKQDMAEVEIYGIAGNPRIYIGILGTDNTILDGIPNYIRFRRTIRDYQTTIGD